MMEAHYEVPSRAFPSFDESPLKELLSIRTVLQFPLVAFNSLSGYCGHIEAKLVKHKLCH